MTYVKLHRPITEKTKVSAPKSSTSTRRRSASKEVDIPHPRVVPADHASEHQADRNSEVVFGRDFSGATPISQVPSASRPVPELFALNLQRQLNRSAPSFPPVSRTIGRAMPAELLRARLHRGAVADGLTARLGASAFTYGRDVFIHRTVRPGTPRGRSTLAHEATHVLQQRGSAEPMIQCSLAFTKSAAQSEFVRVGTAPPWAENGGLLAEFRAGLKQYLALTAQMSADGSTVESVDDDGDQKKAMEGLIATAFKNPVVMPRAEADEGESLYESVDSTEALRRWTEVRLKIKRQIEKERGKISTAKGAPGLGVVRRGNVQFDAAVIKHTPVAAETGWGGFWFIAHELLHGQNLKDSMKPGSALPKDGKRRAEVVDANGKLLSATQQRLSFTGEIESYLNVIRIAAGLPLRTTYGDAVSSKDTELSQDLFINFSYATAPASEGGVDVRTMRPRENPGIDYPEFVGVRYGSQNNRLSVRQSRMAPGRGLEVIRSEKDAAARSKEIEPWIIKLAERPHAGTLGDKQAEFRFERPSSGTELELIVVAGGKAKRIKCSVSLSRTTEDPGLNPPWDGLKIDCGGDDTIHLGSYLKEREDARRTYYGYDVTYRNKGAKVYFNGSLGKKRVEFSVP